MAGTWSTIKLADFASAEGLDNDVSCFLPLAIRWLISRAGSQAFQLGQPGCFQFSQRSPPTLWLREDPGTVRTCPPSLLLGPGRQNNAQAAAYSCETRPWQAYQQAFKPQLLCALNEVSSKHAHSCSSEAHNRPSIIPGRLQTTQQHRSILKLTRVIQP